jgi:hypothetical protein
MRSSDRFAGRSRQVGVGGPNLNARKGMSESESVFGFRSNSSTHTTSSQRHIPGDGPVLPVSTESLYASYGPRDEEPRHAGGINDRLQLGVSERDVQGLTKWVEITFMLSFKSCRCEDKLNNIKVAENPTRRGYPPAVYQNSPCVILLLADSCYIRSPA